MSEAEDFPHPYPAVDLLLVAAHVDRLRVFLIERTREPQPGWALPGAYVQVEERVEDTGARICRDKLDMEHVPPEDRFLALRPFSDHARDPRRGTISLPRLALLAQHEAPQAEPSSNVDGVARRAWADLPTDLGGRLSVDGEAIDLVFDHRDIVTEGVTELRQRLELGDHQPLRDLLPGEFTLRRLQGVHEAILGRKVNRDSFRRKVLAGGELLDPTGHREEDVEHRPAELYRWGASRR